MQQQAIEVASDAMEKYSVEKDIAMYIKKEVRHHLTEILMWLEADVENVQFDSRAGATWHCIVGRNFGSFVTHGQSSNIPHQS